MIKHQIKIAFLILCLTIFLMYAWTLFKKTTGNQNNASNNQNSSQNNELILHEVSSTLPFYELTIPYLRSKTYKSTLGLLNSVKEYPQYTSYITSYTSDDNTIYGLLTIPKENMPKDGYPAIVFVHGYIPPTQYKTQEKYVEYVDYLAKNGFVVFKIDLRGHGESEGQPSGSYYSSGYVIDTLNAISALQSQDFVHKDNIGLWGHSMSGNIVMRSIATNPNIKAAVIWAGAGYTYKDLLTYGLNDASYRPAGQTTLNNSRREQLFNTHGRFDENSAFWKQVVPTNYLTDFKGGIQLHHAENDTVVNIGYSKDLNSVLDTTNIPHEFFSYKTGGHNIASPSFSLAMKRTTEFFNRHFNITR